MSLLSYSELRSIQDASIIEHSLPEHVNSASIDITLGPLLLYEVRGVVNEVALGMREPLQLNSWRLDSDDYVLSPGEFVLAQSKQIFNLPNWLSAEYKLKSSMARIGLEHLTAGWCDAGWHGSVLTLELKNMTRCHSIRLHLGDRIGQVIFFRHAPVPDHASYATRGNYNNHKQTTGAFTK